MKFSKDHVDWGRYTNKVTGEKEYSYWFYWWNWLPKKVRYWGFEYMYYDGPHGTFGLWFINFSWRTKWTRYDFD